MDKRPHPPHSATQGLELPRQLAPEFRTLVTKLDAIEGGQLLRVCRRRLRP
jgi:hypothetical protein